MTTLQDPPGGHSNPYGYPPVDSISAPQKPTAPPVIVRSLSPFHLPARHRLEIPLLVVSIVVMVLIYPASVYLAVTERDWGSELTLFALVPILYFLSRGYLAAEPRVNGVKLTENQFPEGYRMLVEASARFGLAQVPEAYVQLGNGVVNAHAVGHGFRRYVVLNSDLFEIGGEARDPDALAFVIGHEVGHIAAGHTSYWRLVGMAAVAYIPFLGSALSRAQEYTADNHGFCFRPQGAAGAIRLFGAGKYLNKYVDANAMADRATTERGFFVWAYNALSSHPVNTWRSAALRNRFEHGRLLARPKAEFKQS